MYTVYTIRMPPGILERMPPVYARQFVGALVFAGGKLTFHNDE